MLLYQDTGQTGPVWSGLPFYLYTVQKGSLPQATDKDCRTTVLSLHQEHDAENNLLQKCSAACGSCCNIKKASLPEMLSIIYYHSWFFFQRICSVTFSRAWFIMFSTTSVRGFSVIESSR